MALLGKRFGSQRRAGQALNANANVRMNNGMNAMVNPAERTNPTYDLEQASQSFAAYQVPEGGEMSIDQFEEDLDVDIDGSEDEQGNRYVVVTDEASGAQAFARFPPAPVQVPPQQDNVCEFPVQSLQLQRQVNISTTAPQILDVQTDICGNTIGFTESVTRRMEATEWTPMNGSQGPVVNTYVNGNGVVRGRTLPPIPFANSPGQVDYNGVNESVVNNGLFYQNNLNGNGQVGSRRAGQAFNGNKNLNMGRSMMRGWKQA